MSSPDRAHRAGILVVTMPDHQAQAVGAALNAEGISATIRPEHVRLSPHVSTTADTIDQLALALKRLREPSPTRR